MTDYKQLCAELVAAWDDLPWHYDWKGNLIGLADGCQLDDSAVERARAALAKPEPEGPTDEELNLLADYRMLTDGETGAVYLEHLDYARAVLARWGNHLGSPDSSTPQPISVTERLPRPEDCDAEGRCWLCGKVEGDWRLLDPNNSGVPRLKYCFSHWLPAHALPLPS